MPSIDLENEMARIRSHMAFRKETVIPLTELANTLLCEKDGVSPADRKLIAP
jgi:hypothetical protein